MLPYVVNIGGWWYYRRRIPNYVQPFDKRKQVKISLKTSDKLDAARKANIYNDHIENYWKELVQAGEQDTGLHKYQAVVQLAQAHGFAYKTANEVAQSPLAEILNRLEQNLRTKNEADALIGGVEQPELLLSKCLAQYWELTTDRLVNKTEHKIRKWKNPRKSAFENFLVITGDKPVREVARTDILAFKEWWRAKVATGHSSSTANKQLQQVKDILKTVTVRHEINLEVEMLFADIKFKQLQRSRPPFDASYVQEELLPGLRHLNDRDKMVIYAIADTGARESEIFGLQQEDILLNEKIPHIWIRPKEGHSLKTATSERKIPLVGVALFAFKQNPKGFRHKGNPDVFSSIVNKYLTEQNLRPTPQHSIYSLRHTFKDRLRDIGAPEEIIDDLMGHKKTGPKYGRGHTLEAKHKWLQQIAYKTPPQR